MPKLLALLVLVVRFALHQRRPGDPPGGRNRPGDSDPPPPAEAVKPAQRTAQEKLQAGQPPGSRPADPHDPGQPGEPGDPNDPGDPGDPDDPDGDFTTPQPDGVPKKRDDKWLKKNGVDPHEVKGDLPGPMSHFDLYVDRSGNIWAVRKGADPRSGEYVGNVDDYAD